MDCSIWPALGTASAAAETSISDAATAITYFFISGPGAFAPVSIPCDISMQYPNAARGESRYSVVRRAFNRAQLKCCPALAPEGRKPWSCCSHTAQVFAPTRTNALLRRRIHLFLERFQPIFDRRATRERCEFVFKRLAGLLISRVQPCIRARVR